MHFPRHRSSSTIPACPWIGMRPDYWNGGEACELWRAAATWRWRISVSGCFGTRGPAAPGGRSTARPWGEFAPPRALLGANFPLVDPTAAAPRALLALSD